MLGGSEIEEVVTAPRAAALMESTRSVGYSFESAIADIVDNSIGAGAISIRIESLPSTDPYVAILDDGEGMAAADLQEAMRYGTDPGIERTGNDLGRFGLGMKMASLSQCRKLTVISLCNGNISACRWDLDRVLQTNEWTLQVLNRVDLSGLPMLDDLIKGSKGTLVVWEKLDRIINKISPSKTSDNLANSIEICKDHLSMTFHRFMDIETGPNKLSIHVNGVKLEPFDPFLTHRSTWMQEQSIEMKEGTIRIKPFILPHESKLTKEDVRRAGGLDPKMQGFYVYRNKRLIIPGNWFKLTRTLELRKLVRVRVDIPNTLDFMWDIDVKKSNATIPAQFRDKFSQILGSVTDSGEKRYSYRGRNENEKGKTFVWNKISAREQFEYSLNRGHPLISELKAKLSDLDPNAASEFEGILKLVESTVPFKDIYNTVAGGTEIGTGSEDMDELFSKAAELLLSEIYNIDKIATTEPFNKYPELIEKLRRFDADQ